MDYTSYDETGYDAGFGTNYEWYAPQSYDVQDILGGSVVGGDMYTTYDVQDILGDSIVGGIPTGEFSYLMGTFAANTGTFA